MAQRGKVLRDTSSGKGLVSSGGSQYEFSLEGCWKSEVAPKIGMVVDFELGHDGNINSISAVPENQLAKEQAELVMQAAKKQGMAVLSGASARVGKSVLVAWGALFIAWFFLNVLNITVLANTTVGVTFWNLLGVVNNTTGLQSLGGNTGDKGIYALLAIVALAGPAVSQFWKDSKAHLGNCLPFILMLAIAVMIYFSLSNSASEAQKQMAAFGGAGMSNMVSQMMSEMLKSIHVGAGGIIAVIASAYLAAIGVKRFLVAKAQA